MITRREAVRLLSSATAGAWFAAAQLGLNLSLASNARATATKDDSTPPLAPGTPMSPERLALIETFKKQSEGLEKKFEARTFKGEWTMPYRLFRPAAAGKLPLVVYLHGSGGQGDDNLKQLGLETFSVLVSGYCRRTRTASPATSSHRRPIGDGLATIREIGKRSLRDGPRARAGCGDGAADH